MMDFGYIDHKALAGLGIVTSEQIISATVRDTEALRRRYSQDPTMMALTERVVSEVDICSNIIARACAMQQIRLYRIGGGRGGRSLSKTRAKAMAAGRMGAKAQSLIESNENIVEVEDHPALDLIRRPNPFYPGFSLDFMAFKFGITHGNFYWVVTDGPNGKILWPGYPQYVQPVFDDNKFISHYIFGRDSSDIVDIAPDQVWHFRNYILNKTNPLMGEGEIAGVLIEADLMIRNNLHDLAFAMNGCRPDAMLKVTSPTPITAEQMKLIYDGFGEFKAGGSKEGMPFIGQHLELVPLAWTPKETLSDIKVENARKAIRRATGVPESMADSNASTFASSLIADSQMGRVVWAKLVHDAAQKTEWLLPEFGLDPTRYVLAYDNPVPRDEQAEVATKTSMLSSGALTINEFRQEFGYEQSEDPMADRLLVAGQPIGSMGFGGLFGSRPAAGTPDQPEAVTDAEGNPIAAEAVQDTALNGAQIAQLVELARLVGTGEITRDAALAIAEAAFPAIPPEKVETIFRTLREGEVSTETDPTDTPPGGGETAPDAPQEDQAEPQAVVRSFDPAAFLGAIHGVESARWNPCTCKACTKAAKEARVDGPGRDLLERFGADFQADLEAIIEDAQAEAVRAFYDGEAPTLTTYREQAEKVLVDRVEAIAADAIRAEITALQLSDDLFSVVPERALEFARSYTIELVDDIMGTTADMAKVAVERGLEQGLSIANIQKEMEGIPAYRAEMIARTEVSRAANGGRYESFKALGATHAEWLLAPGACPLCTGVAANPIRELGQPYATAGEVINGVKVSRTFLYPPAHPNDRCGIEPLFPEDMQ